MRLSKDDNVRKSHWAEALSQEQKDCECFMACSEHSSSPQSFSSVDMYSASSQLLSCGHVHSPEV